jgi:hypothetical protein
MVFAIAPYGDECFLMYTPKTESKLFITGSFEMVDDVEDVTAEPVLMYVMHGKTEELLYQSKSGTGRGNFRVPVDASQKYWMCLQNNSQGPDEEDARHPDELPRTIGFRYRLDMGATEKVQDPLDPHNQKLDTWLKHAGAVNRELQALMDHFGYMKNRESKHRDIAEGTFAETMTWTLIEAGAVCLVAIAQVFYLRSFLEQKRY